MPTLTLDTLKMLVNGDAVAVRVRQQLQPAGGPGDKVFPPTFGTDDEKALKYATEKRRINGQDVMCVLLDSVASQANRMEEALLAAWEDKTITFPVIGVTFPDDLASFGTVTTLQAPHRLADAILRDSEDEQGTPFRNLPEGVAYTNASLRNATAVLTLCPTALVFGVWDSTGPLGGSGGKFPRTLTSEIVAIDAVAGSKVSSRIDPLGIEAVAGPIYKRADTPTDWTLETSEAAQTSEGEPETFGKSGRPSEINHSNIKPSIDQLAGGITFSHALQTIVLSLPAIRRLRFTTDLTGKPFEDRAGVENAARVALSALALAGIVHQRAKGFDLRSRCVLVPDGDLTLEIVRADGSVEAAGVSVDDANQLLNAARKELQERGVAWDREPLRLRAANKLVALIRRSRNGSAAGEQ